MIEFLCPRCQTALVVADDEAGRKQRCPQCQGKLQVPVPPAASSAIEFRCPRCHAMMYAPAENAGAKVACSGCGAKVRVPFPHAGEEANGSGKEAAGTEPAAAGKPNPQAAETPSDWSCLPVSSAPDLASTATLAARQFHWAGLLLPVACLAVLVGIGARLLHKPEPKLEGTLTGERLTDVEFGPFRLDRGFLGEHIKNVRDVVESLESEPIRTVSPALQLEFQGSPAGISISIRTADGAEFCRVNPRTDKALANYLDREKDRLRAFRNEALRKSVPEFFEALERRSEVERDVEGLAAFRNSVGLTSLVRGFGLQIQAVIGRKVYPCILEDADGFLYFSLPVETKEFEIASRDWKGKALSNPISFPGRYQVVVSEKPVTANKPAPDPKQKIRKLLRD